MERYIAAYAKEAGKNERSGGGNISERLSDLKEEDQLRHVSLRSLDPDTDYKVQRVATRINESFQLLANEPSLGLYRIQEHIKRTMPLLNQRRLELEESGSQARTASLNLDYALTSANQVASIRQLVNVREALKNSIESMNGIIKLENQSKAEKDMMTRVARKANRSISQNSPAEGYICPVCYFALETQTDLISHWSAEHNMASCANDVFQHIEMPKNGKPKVTDDEMDFEGKEEIKDHVIVEDRVA